MLKEINDKIKNKEFKYENTLIIGDNSSGKSELLKEILKEEKENFYFIDSVNRIFNYEIVGKTDKIKNTYKSVVKSRLEENIFNLKDSFDIDKSGIGYIEQVYFNFEDELKAMIQELLDIEFNIISENNQILGKRYNLSINGNIEKLSSGYQAIVRILLELIYFKNSIEKESLDTTVVIDEINEFLSTKNEERILPFFMRNFSNINFIVTTHSADVIASSIDCNIIILKNNEYECLDGNDFTSITDVREIFERIYNIHENNEINDVEIILRNLLNNKISDTWTEIDEKELDSIIEEKLTNAQKLILKQIKSW